MFFCVFCVYNSQYNLKETLHRCQHSLALFYQKLENFPKALKLLEEAICTVTSLKNRVFQCEYLVSKGHLLLLMNNYTAARHAFRKAFNAKSPVIEDAEMAQTRFQIATTLCKALKTFRKLDHQKLDPACKDNLTIRLCDRIGDLLVELEAYSAAVTFYMQELDAAIRANKPDSFIATIYVSIAQTYMDDKKYEKAIDFFNKELSLRNGNPVEETRTFLKIIEATIGMEKPKENIINMYESALDKYGHSLTCKKRILKDYAIYLEMQGGVRGGEEDLDKLKKVKDALAQLKDVDVDVLEDVLSLAHHDTNEEEPLHLSDLSSDSSLSSDTDEEVKGLNSCITVPGGARAKRCVKKKIRTNEVGETPLHRACIEGDEKKVNKLIESGHPINPRDHCGWLPLHEACNHGFTEIVRALLNAGAHINDPGGEKCGGTTPLHDACSNCHVGVIELLVSRGADVTKLDSEGNHALDCLRAWRSRVGADLSPEEEKEYQSLVTLLEEKMKASGFDLKADKLRLSSIEVSTRAPVARKITRRTLQEDEETCSHQPASLQCIATKKKRKQNQRSDLHESSGVDFEKEKEKDEKEYRGEGEEDDDEEATVAREVYRDAIEKLRKGNTFSSPQDTSGHESIHSGPRSALINDTERIDVDEWLVHDLPRTSAKRSHDLYNLDSLPKRQRGASSTSPRKIRSKNKSSGKSNVSDSHSHTSTPIVIYDDSVDVDFDLQTDGITEKIGEKLQSDDVMTHEMQVKSNSYSNASSESNTITSSGGRKMLIKVHVEGRTFLVKIPDENKTVSWLAQETVQRYFNLEKKKPVIYLETKDGAILCPDDLIGDVVMTDELCAIVQSFESLTPVAKYEENCKMAGLTPLSDIENLLRFCGSLDLSYTVIPSAHEKLLWQSINGSNITVLDLSYCDLSSERKSTVFTLLPSLKELEELKLRACGLIAIDLYDLSKANLCRLLNLDLSYNKGLTGQPLTSLIASLPTIRTLSLISCDLVADTLRERSFIEAINKNSSLHQLLVEEELVNEAGSDLLCSKIRGTHFPSLTCNIRYTISTSNK